jgi:hypothetical protein
MASRKKLARRAARLLETRGPRSTHSLAEAFHVEPWQMHAALSTLRREGVIDNHVSTDVGDPASTPTWRVRERRP